MIQFWVESRSIREESSLDWVKYAHYGARKSYTMSVSLFALHEIRTSL